MATIPFKIHVPDHKLERLSQKLALTDYPNDGPTDSKASWDRGVPVTEIQRLTTIWRTRYNWRRVEAHLNTFAQYITPVNVDGFGVYDIHHIHGRSSRMDAIPLLFLHGWPGSFVEVTKMLENLMQGPDRKPAFHVVAPSLIDFGFSSSSGSVSAVYVDGDGISSRLQKFFGIDQHAEAYNELMLKLGYDKYVIQAGDVGSVVTRFIALKYGRVRCMAYHTSTPATTEPDANTYPELHAKLQSTPLSETEKRGLERAALFSKEGVGYYKQLSTKPQTIGYSLRDSPVGLLAWMYEKMHEWSDNYAWTDEEILTWVSIYYFSTPGPEASSNVYYAMEHSEPTAFTAASAYADVPFGVARFANDLFLLPKLWNHSLGPVVFESEHNTGGHFAAWEQPDLIVQDLQNMFGKNGGASNMTQSTMGSEKPESIPDENLPAAIDARRREMQALEQAAIEILGPCPPDLKESTIDIRLSDHFVSRTIIIRPISKESGGSRTSENCPLIVYIHGGSFAFDTPNFVLSPARAFASYFGAIVACPSYKLAPDNPFPAPMQSAWEVVAWLSNPQNLKKGPLKNEGIEFDPSLGFVLAGCSAGASISAVISGIAAAAKTGNTELVQGLRSLVSPITGLFVSLPHIVHRDIVPAKHASAFRSREENANAPILDAVSLANSAKRLKTDIHSPWFSPSTWTFSRSKNIILKEFTCMVVGWISFVMTQ